MCAALITRIQNLRGGAAATRSRILAQYIMANYSLLTQPATRAALCIGDPDAFASEMIKLINDKEFRFACLFVCVHNFIAESICTYMC